MNIDFEIRILVVDDQKLMRVMVKKLLRNIGFEDVDMAKHGTEALEALKKREYGLVICDWNMPEMDGLELLKSIRKDSKLKDLLFIMLTAENEKNKVEEAIILGITDYIVKPITVHILEEKIEKAFDQPLES